MSTATSVTREELIKKREQLLERARMSYEELRERAMAYTLGAEERDVYEAIRSIDYLLKA